MISNYNRKQGLGNELLTILFTIMYAKIHNLDFQYTPILLDHINSKKELEDIENILGFKNNYTMSSFTESFETYQKVMQYINKNIEQLDFSQIKLNNYTIFNNNKNIVIHIRRSNNNDLEKSKTSKGIKKYIDNINKFSDKLYIQFIEKLILKYPDHNIHIYSQNLDIENYKKFDKLIFHIDTNLIETFCSFINADILVTGASSLSYCAALLRSKDKEVIYLKYNYKPLKHWILFDDIIKIRLYNYFSY